MKKAFFPSLILATFFLAGCNTRDPIRQSPVGQRLVNVQNWTYDELIVFDGTTEKILRYNEIFTVVQIADSHNQVPPLEIRVFQKNLHKTATFFVPPATLSKTQMDGQVWFTVIEDENKKLALYK